METQKIINLLNDIDNESSRFATRKWYAINDKKIESMAKEMKMIQALNLRQKSLNHFRVITQMHIYLQQDT